MLLLFSYFQIMENMIWHLWSITYPAPPGEWTPVFSKSEEHEIAANSLVTTFDQGKTWRISFELNPGKKWPKDRTQNIFQLTTGSKRSKSPALFLPADKEKGFQITSSIDGDPSNQKFMGKQNLPPLQEWTQLVFEQREEVGGEFVFAFSQGNAEMYNVSNSDPQEFPNMKVTSNQHPSFKGKT